MRASFLLVLALALLVGLGVAVAVKSSGFLNPPPPQTIIKQEPAPAPPPPPPPPSVLVATRNLYAEDTIRAGDVKVRPARNGEVADYEAHKADFLPATPEVAFYRFADKNIFADVPLKKSDLKDLAKPEALHARLAPGTRAVNVSIPKEGSAGGLIQVGDWVDVYLTTEVGRTDEPVRMPQTGLIARGVQVIAKRDTLWTIFAALPVGENIQYTLGANPYRSALIDYAASVGTLSIAPVSIGEKKELDERKKTAMQDASKVFALTVLPPDSAEYKEESKRVEDYGKGSLSVGTEDLAKALNLKPILPPPPPPAPAPPPPPPVTVDVYSGTTKQATATFPVKTDPPPPAPLPAPPAAKYYFVSPPKPGVARQPAAPATPPFNVQPVPPTPVRRPGL